MRKEKKLSFILFLTFISFTYAFGQVEEKKPTPIRFLYGVALELGGDDVAEIYYTNGTTNTIPAGQGASAFVGGELQIPKVEKFLIRASIGYKYITNPAENVHIRFTRIPIHLTANYMAAKKLRFSGGITSHRNIKFNSGGLGGNFSLKPATGPVFEIAYAGIGLTYTAMQYKGNKNDTYSANAIGLSLTGVFPRK